MISKIVLPAVALVLALATSGNALHCYECKSTSLADDSCSGEMLKSMSREPIECNIRTMVDWYKRLGQDPVLAQIASIFEVPETHYPNSHQPMACAKLTMKVDNQPVILRTCQTPKTNNIDPCKATRDKISQDYKLNGHASLLSCDLCDGDRCNGSYNVTPTMLMSLIPLIGTIIMSLAWTSA